jgi:hypothetical protein
LDQADSLSHTECFFFNSFIAKIASFSHQRRLKSHNGGDSGAFLQEQRQSQSLLVETAPTSNPRNRPHCGWM